MSNFLSRWLVQRRLAHVPKITVDVTRNYYMTFTAPNPDVKVIIKNEAGITVGRACYAVSPLNDRVYIFEVEILSAHRRQGYGTALLLFLAQTYDLPITVVKELYSACSFWRFARGLGSAGIRLTQQLSVSDMASEAERWAHLQPKARQLEFSELLDRNFVFSRIYSAIDDLVWAIKGLCSFLMPSSLKFR
ncbi:GNAT family N-acetyltransferase [Paracidovorax valerianellae]|uniref:GNAT family N-acetyltransferase n=1 Tax=Paracidovorax valerianellae TaxID=187868 RepID=UPI001587EB6F|nr:GNAT family N-acetyltransferase [Paracidovorax valerianellae]MDA8445618.1 GNAT family N-acetyltransferase [Paracidovorax valerianellae]